MFRLTYINESFASAYLSLRSSIFSIIYPAPSIVKPRTTLFNGIQSLVKSFIETHPDCHPVIFDFAGNMQFAELGQTMKPGNFEAIFIAKDKNLYHTSNKYLIYLGGNTSCYQILIADMYDLHEHHNACVIGFNPPGVGMSPGPSDLDKYCDGLRSIINHLAQKGIPYTRMLVIGHSLGAGIAAKVVNEYRQEGKEIFLFVDRTMISISDAVGATMRNSVPTRLLRYTIGYFLYLLAKLLIKFLKLELHVAKSFLSINSIEPGAAHGMMAHEDEMLIDYCLSDALPTTPHFKRFKLKDDADNNRRTHSIARNALVEVNGQQSADQFLHSFIKRKLSLTGG